MGHVVITYNLTHDGEADSLKDARDKYTNYTFDPPTGDLLTVTPPTLNTEYTKIVCPE
jgi:hypothetical protein